MVFRVPSSTPPSTPDSRRASRTNIPSTTPAGPPPSRMIPSSTPAGPPPSTFFGSSQLHTGAFGGGGNRQPLFQKSGGLPSSPPKRQTPFGGGGGRFAVPDSTPQSNVSRGRTVLRAPGSSPPDPYAEEESEEEYSEDEEVTSDEEDDIKESDEEDDVMEEYDEEEDSEGEEEEGGYDPGLDGVGSTRKSAFSASARSQGYSLRDPALFDSFRDTQRSRLGESTRTNGGGTQTPTRQRKYDLLTIAKGIVGRPTERLVEPDEMILETEKLLSRMSESGNPMQRGDTIADVAQQLLKLWRRYAGASTSFRASLAGPPTAEGKLAKANYLASLLLQLHYPGAPPSNLGRSSMFGASRRGGQQGLPIPKILLDWLNTFHKPDSEIGNVLREQRGYSASPSYWDAVKYSVLRGNFTATLKLLKGGRFEVAETAPVDGFGENGYEGIQLKNTNAVISDAIGLIQECPAIASDDWDIKGHDWGLFRKQVQQAIEELREFAEGDSPNRASQDSQSDPFGVSASQNNLAMQSRKAESNVPWSIYENLLILYNQLLGGSEEILGIAVDWVEAALGLAIWWDGDEEDGTKGSFAASRRSTQRSQGTRPVDVTPTISYRQKLRSALATVIELEDDSLGVNISSPTEVGIACIFDENLEGLAHILQNWSVVITSATVEVASADNWLHSRTDDMGGFDKSDLMVLSYNHQENGDLDKDQMMLQYARALARKGYVESPDGKSSREGWELGIQVVGRLDDENLSNEFIEEVLNSLELSSAERVDKILDLCTGLGFVDQSNNIAVKYADQLRQSTRNFGDTLLYYARGHESQKIQEVLQILVSECLVHSISYPPVPDLDARLKALITSPVRTLSDLSAIDPEAAQLLSTYLSGYATVRKFYDLRDAILNGTSPLRPMARKRAAANALMVLIASASSSIRGGLYDASVETVIQVDVLLSLLGEALVFVNQPKRTLTLPHLYALLGAIEDLQTAPSLIYKQAEECFAATLAGVGRPTSPSALLKKSVSNLTTASSQFSLVGSEMLGSGSGTGGVSTESSGVLVGGARGKEVKRAWDWRVGFKGRKVVGVDVCRLLRLGIAEEIGRAWVEE